MRVSESWLREWCNPPLDTAGIAERLTMAGIEVGAIEPVAGAFDDVVVARIVSTRPHPDADRLRLCEVEAAIGEPLIGIVCGAPNARPDLCVPLAGVGARLPGGLHIKKSKIRGEPSEGMLCSSQELGLGEGQAGLLELPDDAPIGTPLRDYLQLDDQVIEVELTPNRGDCLGLSGLARELAALTDTPLTAPDTRPVPAASDRQLAVRLDAPAACPRYLCRVVDNVNVQAPSPLWLQERLRRAGLRSLGPVVDITNLVLLELGQPLHAFDLDRVGTEIVVRQANAGEKLRLLNGQDIEADPDLLLICDAARPLAAAGIMGGAESAVGDATRSVLLESAFFAPRAMAGRARRLGLQTDASQRFERGVDPHVQRLAIERATQLLIDLCGGVPGPVVEACSEADLPAAPAIRLRAARVAQVLGCALADDEIESILSRLGCALTQEAAGIWQVTPPSRRFDLAIEEDLIEELARVRGYETLPAVRPAPRGNFPSASDDRVSRQRLTLALVDRGYQEAITYSFVEPKLQALVDPARKPLALANPLSAELAVMRTSLWPGLLQAYAHNANRQAARVRLFEVGLRFIETASGLDQAGAVAGLIAGPRSPEQWGVSATLVDFFDLKADVEALLASTGCAGDFTVEPAEHPALHPGQSACLRRGGQAIGWLGRLHPQLETELGLDDSPLLFEIELAALSAGRVPAYAEVSRFPSVRRDIAVVLPQSVQVADILATARSAFAEAPVQDILVFDVYQGAGVPAGCKSVALGITLAATERTLTDADVDPLITRVLHALAEAHQAHLRD
ncbi:MAG: phenylalanine--tRNA ligase subunit beta [Immundisolibacter sp.]|uniref:phenylalanine--tRNA ligase subunit beta n=1 Tax=Immundisolibacter sp. TaxID=1934948 RepID=UPI003D0E014D